MKNKERKGERDRKNGWKINKDKDRETERTITLALMPVPMWLENGAAPNIILYQRKKN